MDAMRIHIATDHAGLDFSTQLQDHLRSAGHEVVDHGPVEYDALDDYPAFCIPAAQAVVADQAAGVETLGVVFGGSGNGEQIAANRVAGIRAALAYEPELARLARQHNDAHIVSIGARFTAVEVAKEIVDAFVSTEFSDEPRHARRLGMVTAYETSRELPAATQGAEGSAS
jgi:ribose 5-phosphate isomerase B